MKMRITTTALTSLALSLLAVPAMACEFHGGTGWFQAPASQWQNFNPRASFEDPAFADDNAEEDDFTPFPARAKKPSFSNAADRASKAAKARLAMTNDRKKAKSKPVEEKKPELIVREVSLETNAEPVR